MIPGLDSAFPPSALSISAARGAGIRVWAGYFAGPNIYNGWSQAAFHQVQTGGLGTFAYCSGLSDPKVMRAQSLTWGVPICLDVEGGIRPDGAWVQGWLDAAACGLYGNAGVHKNRTAAFHVLAAYPSSDPHATWPAFLPRPASPCGWQWQGTHAAFGTSVDSSWLDDDLLGLFGGDPSHSGGLNLADYGALIQDIQNACARMDKMFGGATKNADGTWTVTGDAQLPNYLGWSQAVTKSLADIETAVKAIAGGGGLTAAQAAQLSNIETIVKDIRSKFA